MLITQDKAGFMAFMTVWETLHAYYGRTCSDIQAQAAHLFFVGYDSSDLTKAVKQIMRDCERLPENPVPMMLKAVRASYGVTEQAARKAFSELSSLAYCDVVITDRRMAYAIRKCFGTVNNYVRQPGSAYENERQCKEFVSVYLTATEEDIGGADCVFWQNTHRDANYPYFKIIGDKTEGKRLASEAAAAQGYKGARVDADPLSQSMMIEEKRSDPPLSPEDQKDLLSYALRKIKALSVPPFRQGQA